MTPEQTSQAMGAREALTLLIAARFPDVDLAEHHCWWTKLPDDRDCLAVDVHGGGVLFTQAATNPNHLLVTGPCPDGYVRCWRVTPDGRAHLRDKSPDPFASEQARLN